MPKGFVSQLILMVTLLVIVVGMMVYLYRYMPELDGLETVPIQLQTEGDVVDFRWQGEEDLLILLRREHTVGSGSETEESIEYRLLQYNLSDQEARQLYREQGRRLRVDLLDASESRGEVALREEDELVLLDEEGAEVRRIEEAGSETRGRYASGRNEFAYTAPAEWEMPTNLHRMDLETGETEVLTDYGYGQAYKVGAFDWSSGDELYYVEQFAHGTVTLGGKRLFRAPAGHPAWEAPGGEEIIGFEVFGDEHLYALFVRFDGEYLESRLFVGKTHLSRRQLVWEQPLEEMGDRGRWLEIGYGYPTEFEYTGDSLWVSGLMEGDFAVHRIDTDDGSLIETIERATQPRISPDGSWLLYRPLDDEEADLMLSPVEF